METEICHKKRGKKMKMSTRQLMSLGDIFNFAFQAFERRISEISEMKAMKHLVMFLWSHLQ